MGKVEIKKKRHVAKTITWRIVGTLDTFLISTFLIHYINESSYSESALIGGWISGLEIITKTILYYIHERLWYTINWISSNQLRHIVKTISWRLVGAIDTIALVFIVFYFATGTIEQAPEVAISMFSIEIITKMVLYYIHERVWITSNWGVVKPEGH
ncbi:DUF2061 domain-containing protein [Flavobacteriales bacterium]|nr:DUF2061 domain-containing protein [Flavobacteriales bacterium]